jgi:hypothetical protein
MIWSRKQPASVHDRSHRGGVDVTSSRVRVAVAGETVRALVLDEPADDLVLAVAFDRRPAIIGRTAVSQLRTAPHAVAVNILPHLGHPKEWRAGRAALSPDAAVGLAFETIRSTVVAEADAVGVAVPSYLTPPQVVRLAELAAKVRLPVKGTAVAALALVADRAAGVAGDAPIVVSEPDTSRPDWVVPMRPVHDAGPGAVLVVDADDHALSASVVAVEAGEVRLLTTAAWPKLSRRLWKDRLLDYLSDRCVRQCRRDPRDSADAEQRLYDQLDPALDRVRYGQPVQFGVRAAHWYQDLIVQPADFDASCAAYAKVGIAGVTELAQSCGLPEPPRAVWLTPAAGTLPGLAAGLYAQSSERTDVAVLNADAVAGAVAALVPRWAAGELPRTHLDVVIPRMNVSYVKGYVSNVRQLAPARRQ